MFEIPTSITIGDTEFPIREKGDYRMVMDCFKVLNDIELTTSERLYGCLVIFYDDMECVEDLSVLGDLQKAVDEMFKFFNCGQEQTNHRHSPKLIDWEQDAQMIASAVNKVAGKEIRFEPYVHWWTFMGYYMAIGESVLSTVVTIRHKLKKNKKLEKYEQDFKRDNPDYFVWKNNTEELEAERMYEEAVRLEQQNNK